MYVYKHVGMYGRNDEQLIPGNIRKINSQIILSHVCISMWVCMVVMMTNSFQEIYVRSTHKWYYHMYVYNHVGMYGRNDEHLIPGNIRKINSQINI